MAKQQSGDYEIWKTKHNFSTTKDNKKEFDTIKRVRQDFTSAQIARQSNCYWYQGIAEGDDSSQGGDWNDKWDEQEKLWIMWYQPSSSDDFRSNVKLPDTTGRIESTMHKIKKFSPAFNAFPNDEEDEEKAKIASILLDYVLYSSDAKSDIAMWVKNALIHGSGFARWVYQRVEGNYRFPKTDPKKMDKDEIKAVKEGEIVWSEKEPKIRYEGFALIPINVEEIYVNANARNLHGNNYKARYIIWRRLMHIDDFKAEFGKDRNCKNIDKVKPTSSYKGNDFQDYGLFNPPVDVIDEKTVEVLEYENVVNDEYIILANDIMIRNTPLPYYHKDFTFHKVDCIKHIKQFYGIGIPDLLVNIQGTAEVTLNMMIDKMWRTLNKKYLVEAGIYGEFTEGYARSDSQFIPVSSPDGQPVSTKITPLPDEQFGFESFNLMKLFEQYSTMATQIDPAQMNLQQAGRTATASAMSRELIEAMISSILDNLGECLTDIGRQTWSMIKQKWSIPTIQKILGEDGNEIEEKVPRKIRIDGKSIKFEEGKYSIENNAKKYSFLEINDSLLNTKADYDIRIAPDSLKVLSRAQEMQKIQEAYAQMMPNAVDPSDPQKIAMHPLPLYDATKIARKYVDTMGLSDDLLLNENEDSEEEIEEAKQHIVQIISGEKLIGEPGKGRLHVLTELRALNAITEKVENLAKEYKTTARTMFDPMTGQPIPMPNPALEEEYNKWREIQINMAQHLEIESMGTFMKKDAALMQAAPQQPPQQQQPPIPMPDGGMGFDAQMAGGNPMGMPGQMPMNQPMPSDMPFMEGVRV